MPKLCGSSSLRQLAGGDPPFVERQRSSCHRSMRRVADEKSRALLSLRTPGTRVDDTTIYGVLALQPSEAAFWGK